MRKGIKLTMIMAFLLLSCTTIGAVSAANVYNITDESYSNYFNASGYINDTNIVGGDVLDCSGAIKNKDMYIDRPLNITSSNKTGTIFNGTINILSTGSGTNITNLVFNNTNHNGKIAPGTIVITESDNNIIANNVIITNQEGNDSYGICLIEANNNQIHGNTITTTGDGTGSAKKGNGKYTYGVYLEESSSNVFDSNNIKTTGSSADVDWSSWQNGGVYATTGVFLYSASDNNNFTNNTINTNYNLIHSTTGFDTLLGVRIHQESCGNNFTGNLINTNGFSYAYGVEIVGTYGCLESTGNIISKNTIHSVGNNYANGVKVSAYTEDTLISNNDISAKSNNFAYGIYLENFFQQPNNITVTGNNVTATANEAYALELYLASGHNITNNNFTALGKTGSYGIHLMSGSNNNQINDNNVTTEGTGMGTTYGVFMEGSSSNVLNSNTINTTGFAGDVDWSPYPNPGIYSTLGVFLYDGSNNNLLTNNTIITDYNAISASGYDTLLGVRLCEDCSGNNLTGNTINTNGYSYGYGMEIVGASDAVCESNVISNNKINTVGKNYANGVKVSGYTKDTVVSGNNISAIANNFAYGLYLENTGGLENVTATGNNVTAAANTTYALELYRASGHTIQDNLFNSVGKGGSYGIHLMSSSNSNNISRNQVTTNGNGITYGVYLDGSSSNVLDSNNINTTGLAGNVDWSHYPKPGIYPTLGVFIYDGSNNNLLTNNTVITDYNKVSGSDDTILGVRLCEDCSGNNLTGNTINTTGNSFSYGLEIMGADDESFCSSNVISDNNISSVGDRYATGVKVSAYTEDTLVSGNQVQAAADDYAYGIYLENYGGLENVSVIRNIVNVMANINYAIELYAASGHTITNNTLNGVGNYSLGIATIGSKNNNISQNKITITGNNSAVHIPNGDAIPEGNDGIKLYTNSNNNIVNDNIIRGFIVSGTGSSNGIHLYRSKNNSIENNIISNSSGLTNGILLEKNSINNTLMDNNIYQNDGNGIELNESNGNTVSGNDVSNNGEDGVNLEQSTDNEVTNNSIYENDGVGIRLNDSEGNNIHDNNIHDNGEINVESVDPANGTMNVSVNTAINITFFEPIQAGSAFANIRLKYPDGSGKPITVSISGNTLTITPKTSLAFGTTFTVYIPVNAIVNSVGSTITGVFTSKFTTTNSPVLAVTGIDPANGTTSVPVNQVITVTFSEPIQAGSAFANIRLKYPDGSGKPINVSISDNTLTITPKTSLAFGTLFTVYIPVNAIVNSAGSTIVNTYTSKFTTTNSPVLAVTGIDPANGTTSVPVNQVVTVTFSEPILAGSAFANIRLKYPDGSGKPVNVSISGNTLTITPKTSLAFGTLFTVYIPVNAIVNSAGSTIVNTYTSKFTTTT